MKNKKGFTLIELLAVIVILAIIAVIATPIIIGIINDAREDAKVRSLELYVSSLETAYMQDQVKEDPVVTNPYDLTGLEVNMSGEEVVCLHQTLDINNYYDGKFIIADCMIGGVGWYHFYNGKAHSEKSMLKSLELYAELLKAAYEEDQKKANPIVTDSRDLSGLNVSIDNTIVSCQQEYIDAYGDLVLQGCGVDDGGQFNFKNGKALCSYSDVRSFELYAALLKKAYDEDQLNPNPIVTDPSDLSGLQIEMDDDEVACESQYIDSNNLITLLNCTVNGLGPYSFVNGEIYLNSSGPSYPGYDDGGGGNPC